jgi:hypothetical protein
MKIPDLLSILIYGIKPVLDSIPGGGLAYVQARWHNIIKKWYFMKSNTDPSFVGIEKLKHKHHTQIVDFKNWAKNNDWERFHASHYDWWVFPANRRSSYGLTWVVYEEDIAHLKQDSLFIEEYLLGVELVSASWGWDLYKSAHIQNPQPGQSWHHWPVRLYKAAYSVRLFGYPDMFDSLKTYARYLLDKSESMSYNSKDLSWLFTTGIDPYGKF